MLASLWSSLAVGVTASVGVTQGVDITSGLVRSASMLRLGERSGVMGPSPASHDGLANPSDCSVEESRRGLRGPSPASHAVDERPSESSQDFIARTYQTSSVMSLRARGGTFSWTGLMLSIAHMSSSRCRWLREAASAGPLLAPESWEITMPSRRV